PSEIAEADAVLVLDVRGETSFRKARLEVAVRVPIERWEAAARDPETSLSNVAFWEKEIGRLGIDGSRLILIHDDGRMTEAARVWFILQHFGAPARVVNGGWPALKDAFARWVTSGDPGPVSRRRFMARVGAHSVRLVEREDVRHSLDGAVRVLDARTAAEFVGDDLRGNLRGGHLPGAVHLAHVELLDAAGHLRPAGELRELLLGAGLRRDDRLITHCDGGGRAALAAIAALRSGHTDVHVYYLSFADWAKDETCPIVRT